MPIFLWQEEAPVLFPRTEENLLKSMQCQNSRACAQNGNLHSLPISPGPGTQPESLGRQLFKEKGNRLVKESF